MKRGRSWKLLAAALFAALSLAGCSPSSDDPGDRQKVEFTVVGERELPPELLETIEENKERRMRLTYRDGDEMYLICGYGEQKTGGYGIAVLECAEDEEAVYLTTQLRGPSSLDGLPEEPSWPYIAVKIKASGKEVQMTDG